MCAEAVICGTAHGAVRFYGREMAPLCGEEWYWFRHGHGENVHVREAAGTGSSHGLSSKCSAAACEAKNQTTSLSWPGVPLCQLAKGSGGNFTKLCF